jgi:hypothetical protein
MAEQQIGNGTKQPGGGQMAGGAHDTEVVEDFLDRLARALTSGDGATIARMWNVPALVVSDQEVLPVTSSEQVAKFFGGAKQEYNARGVTGTRGEILNLQWVTDRIAIAEVRWPWLDESGNEVGEEASTYTLRRDDDGNLKICATVMHGAVTH